MELKLKSMLYAVFAVIVVILINYFVLSLVGFPIMAINLINQYWYLFVLLFGGLGLQVGLFVYFKGLNALTCSTTVVSGGVSAVSMILCCSHYLLNLLPFFGALIGSSALFALAEYTVYFLWLGVLSNFIGIFILYSQHKKYTKRRKYGKK